MLQKRNRITALALLCVMILTTGCTPKSAVPEAAAAPAAEPVTVAFSAAKSLTECLPEIAAKYNEAHPEIQLAFNFGSSGSMRQQIEQGAEADLYMPAGVKDVNALKDGGYLNGDTIRNVLGNQLVLVAPADSKLELTGFADLSKDSVAKIAVGDPGSVPAGKYAEETFISVGILEAVKPKIVYAKDVREVLAWTATGNADAGIVYITEAMANDKVKVIAKAEPDSHSPIVYPGAVIKNSKHPEEALAFLDYITTNADARAIFEKYGYTVLSK